MDDDEDLPTETLEQKIEDFKRSKKKEHEGQFTATMYLTGAPYGHAFEEGSTTRVGAFLWGNECFEKLFESGSPRHHAPIRAKIINRTVEAAKAQGAKCLKYKDSGLDKWMHNILAIRKRNGLNKDGKPVEGFKDLDQVQRYIEEGFLKLERLKVKRRDKSPDRVIAEMVAKRKETLSIYGD